MLPALTVALGAGGASGAGAGHRLDWIAREK